MEGSMALIEDMFKGNSRNRSGNRSRGATPRADGYPGHGQHVAAGGQDCDQGRYGLLPRNLGEIGEMASDLVAEARAELEQEARDGNQATSARPDKGSQPV